MKGLPVSQELLNDLTPNEGMKDRKENEIRAVLCEDGNVYQLNEQVNWCKKDKFVGTTAVFDELPAKIFKYLTPEDVYDYVHKGKSEVISAAKDFLNKME